MATPRTIEPPSVMNIAAMMLTLENRNYFGNQGQGYLLIAIASEPADGSEIAWALMILTISLEWKTPGPAPPISTPPAIIA